MIVKTFWDEILQLMIGITASGHWCIWCEKINAWTSLESSGGYRWESR
ncbi:MAG: hypothetical protein ACW99G_11675 [Candidatus Thorarchaeota archaeon]